MIIIIMLIVTLWCSGNSIKWRAGGDNSGIVILVIITIMLSNSNTKAENGVITILIVIKLAIKMLILMTD